MNRSLAYSLLVVAILAVAFIGVSAIVDKSQTTEDQSAAIIGAVSGTAGVAQTITWEPLDFPVTEVTINLIRKTSDNPSSYVLVRVIDAAADNDGSATWTPSATEIGSNLFIEIGCASAVEACNSMIPAAN